MVGPEPLPASALRPQTDPEELSFSTTADLDDLDGALGQERAVEAVQFGIGVRSDGYNIYVLGPPGVGRHTLSTDAIGERAATEDSPDDWAYVYNFEDAQRPRALHLPAGRGIDLRNDMQKLVTDLQAAIPAAFESDDYRARRNLIGEKYKERQEQALKELREQGEAHDIALIPTPVGIAPAPIRNGEVLDGDEFEKLPQEEQDRFKEDIEKLQGAVQEFIRQTPRWEAEQREELRELDREVTRFAVDHLIESLCERYADLPRILEFLAAVREDVLENAPSFIKAKAGDESSDSGEPSFTRYSINLIVDNSLLEGAPVIYEDQPSLHHLSGRIEHISHFGTLVTDFTLIKPGALHRANGGYLILDAHRVLRQPMAWEQLKRLIRSKSIRIESASEILSLTSVASLEPEPIPLDVKVVLIGDRLLYYLLCHYDSEFPELFKVAADFEDRIERDESAHHSFARLMAKIVRNEELLPIQRDGVARILDDLVRRAADGERLSLHIESLSNLLREASYWAAQRGDESVSAASVEQAIAAQRRRAGRLRDRILEEIVRGTLLIDTEGERVGQINGLSVLSLGDQSFGRPSRITARVRMGKGEVVDIERQVELGGPIHSKGVLILGSFLGACYCPDEPLAVSASLVFEQSYGGVDGDSASLAETCALLSALARVPIRQSLAITGSMNQNGRSQAIGGVNEKIEGFFDVCAQVGLNGEQGVIIPRSNVKHLMLREDVTEAAARGEFHIYPVDDVFEAAELLTGREAGSRGDDGLFPEETLNRAVEDRLGEFAANAKEFAGGGKGSES